MFSLLAGKYANHLLFDGPSAQLVTACRGTQVRLRGAQAAGSVLLVFSPFSWQTPALSGQRTPPPPCGFSGVQAATSPSSYT